MNYNYLSPGYWFNPRPQPIGEIGTNILLAIAIIGVIIFAFFLYKYLTEKSKYKKNNFLVIAFFGFVQILVPISMIFFNKQFVAVLRSRFWYIIWVVASIVWLYLLYKSWKNKKEKQKKATDRDHEILKYLPK